MDSYQHLSALLETLSENLKMEGEDNFQTIKQYIKEQHAGSTEKFNLLFRKGVYPYDYMNSCEKFKEGLPPIGGDLVLKYTFMLLKIFLMFTFDYWEIAIKVRARSVIVPDVFSWFENSITLAMNNIFRKKFLVAAILLSYKKEQKSENRPRTPPAPLKSISCPFKFLSKVFAETTSNLFPNTVI